MGGEVRRDRQRDTDSRQNYGRVSTSESSIAVSITGISWENPDSSYQGRDTAKTQIEAIRRHGTKGRLDTLKPLAHCIRPLTDLISCVPTRTFSVPGFFFLAPPTH